MTEGINPERGLGFIHLVKQQVGEISGQLDLALFNSCLYAQCDTDRGEWILDIFGLIAIIHGTGGNGPEDFGDNALRQWLSSSKFQGLDEWLFPTSNGEARDKYQGDFNRATREGFKPILSTQLRDILSQAFLIRNALRPKGGITLPLGVRHILFAVSILPSQKWPTNASGMSLTENDLYDFRRLIVQEALSYPVKDETSDSWRELLLDHTSKNLLEEYTRIDSDSPSAIDRLGREPLAKALAARLIRLQHDEASSHEPKAVMVHLHGSWGSGKSSFVHFLANSLKAQDVPWLVVDFNAWRNSRVKPPWWNMLTEFKRSLSMRLLNEAKQIRWLICDPSLLRWLRLEMRWWFWQATQDKMLLMAGTMLAGLALYFQQADAGLSVVDEKFKDLGSVLTGVAAILTFGRALLLGGGRGAAEAFDALRTDSFRPFISLFEKLCSAAGSRPVLIVLDDLDRCNQSTVTGLLEGIQTLFLKQPVVFLAVADRHWIATSFADRFKLFEGSAGLARPLGDLFLDKIFQVSVRIPELPYTAKRRFLAWLLGVEPEIIRTAKLPVGAETHEDIQAAIAAAPEPERPTLRAEAVAKLSTAAADRVIEHRLMRWAGFIEPNPRAIKRLVSAIGMRQALSLLEGRNVSYDSIVLWTILELQWPGAAVAISADPHLIIEEGTGSDALKAAWTDPLFCKVAQKLDEDVVRALIGDIGVEE